MMQEPHPLDPRSVANLLVEIAAREGCALSNLKLQKILYFMHATYALRTRTPLVSGYFEAWQYGPVHPTVYQAFKHTGSSPILAPATSFDFVKGSPRAIPVPTARDVVRLATNVIEAYGDMRSGQLVALSHAPDGPWDYVVNKAKTSVALGLRITDDVTIARFKHLKVPLRVLNQQDDPDEDARFAAY